MTGEPHLFATVGPVVPVVVVDGQDFPMALHPPEMVVAVAAGKQPVLVMVLRVRHLAVHLM
jgi:hypothetical protein